MRRITCTFVRGSQLCESFVPYLHWLDLIARHSCAEDSTAVMEYCAKVDTRNLQASELQCLTGLILNVEIGRAHV